MAAAQDGRGGGDLVCPGPGWQLAGGKPEWRLDRLRLAQRAADRAHGRPPGLCHPRRSGGTPARMVSKNGVRDEWHLLKPVRPERRPKAEVEGHASNGLIELAREARKRGCPSLWFLSLGQARERDSPSAGGRKLCFQRRPVSAEAQITPARYHYVICSQN